MVQASETVSTKKPQKVVKENNNITLVSYVCELLFPGLRSCSNNCSFLIFNPQHHFQSNVCFLFLHQNYAPRCKLVQFHIPSGGISAFAMTTLRLRPQATAWFGKLSGMFDISLLSLWAGGGAHVWHLLLSALETAALIFHIKGKMEFAINESQILLVTRWKLWWSSQKESLLSSFQQKHNSSLNVGQHSFTPSACKIGNTALASEPVSRFQYVLHIMKVINIKSQWLRRRWGNMGVEYSTGGLP